MNISLGDFIAYQIKNVRYLKNRKQYCNLYTFLSHDNSNIKIVSMNICRLLFFHILNSRNKMETAINIRYCIVSRFFFSPQISI